MPWDEDRGKSASGRRWGDQGSGKGFTTEKPEQSEGAKLDELLQRAEPLIEQLNNLYAIYFAGVEKLPPNERRQQLEALMSQLSVMHKPNPTYRFRVDTLVTRFVTYKDRWDKLLKDLESGKLKRRTLQ